MRQPFKRTVKATIVVPEAPLQQLDLGQLRKPEDPTVSVPQTVVVYEDPEITCCNAERCGNAEGHERSPISHCYLPSVVADVVADLSAEHPVGPPHIHQDHWHQYEGADQ